MKHKKDEENDCRKVERNRQVDKLLHLAEVPLFQIDVEGQRLPRLHILSSSGNCHPVGGDIVFPLLKGRSISAAGQGNVLRIDRLRKLHRKGEESDLFLPSGSENIVVEEVGVAIAIVSDFQRVCDHILFDALYGDVGITETEGSPTGGYIVLDDRVACLKILQCDPLIPVPNRNLPIDSMLGNEEIRHDPFGDIIGVVQTHLHAHIDLLERIIAGSERQKDKKDDNDKKSSSLHQNFTSTRARASSSICRYGFLVKRAMEATMEEGNTSQIVLSCLMIAL